MGTVTDGARERAERIAELVVQVTRERSAGETGHDWTSEQSFADYMYTLGSVEARVEETDDALIVVAWPRMHPHGGYWTNVSSEALDAASGLADDEAGDEFTFESGRIEQADGDYEARLILPGRLPCHECGAKPEEDCNGTCPAQSDDDDYEDGDEDGEEG